MGLELGHLDAPCRVALEDEPIVGSHDDGCPSLLRQTVQEFGYGQPVLGIEVARGLVG